jgi:type III pantothenate kinase
MILAADIGNSRVKLGLFEGGVLRDVLVFPHADLLVQLPAHPAWQEIRRGLQYLGLASVGKGEMAQTLLKAFDWLGPEQVLQIDTRTPMPIGNRYATPATLGVDRICAAAGAFAQHGRGPLLVIDAGTAITYDYVDAAGDYQGGGISPGLRTRFRALQHFTAALPLVEAEGELPLVGFDTVTSIRSGVVNGLIGEINHFVTAYRALAGDGMPVFLTGGDTTFLGNHLKNINFADAHLLLRGIHTVISHNVSIA